MNHIEYATIAYESTRQRFERVQAIMRRTGAKKVRFAGAHIYLDGNTEPWTGEDPQPATPLLDAAEIDLL